MPLAPGVAPVCAAFALSSFGAFVIRFRIVAVHPLGPRPLSSLHPEGGHVLMCDGSVHILSPAADRETLRRLLLRNDSQPVDPGRF